MPPEQPGSIWGLFSNWEPQDDGGEGDEGEVVVAALFVAGGDAAELLASPSASSAANTRSRMPASHQR